MRLTIFGKGRVGASMAHYARSLGCDVAVVARRDAETDRPGVKARIDQSDVVAAAIPDDRLADWFVDWRSLIGARRTIHFSGALLIEGMRSYHPLFSFPKNPLPPAEMAKIAFAREEGAPPLSSILPGAANPEFVVKAGDRAFYHALAVLSGNFAAHLWNETASAFAARFGLAPDAVLAGYLAGVVERFRESPLDSMTGPVARRDRASVEANLAALAGEPRLTALYQAFLSSAWPDFEKDGGNSA